MAIPSGKSFQGSLLPGGQLGFSWAGMTEIEFLGLLRVVEDGLIQRMSGRTNGGSLDALGGSLMTPKIAVRRADR